MLSLQYAFIVLTGLFALSTRAQVVQDDWLAPALPDYSTTITIGETYDIEWTEHLYAWFPYYAPDANVADVDLWITTSNSAEGQLLIQCWSPIFSA